MVEVDAKNRRVLIDGFWIEERVWRSAKDGDAIRCYRGPDAPGTRGRAADDVVERGHRRRSCLFGQELAKRWWLVRGCEFHVSYKRSFLGRMFYLAGMFLKKILLEKRYVN